MNSFSLSAQGDEIGEALVSVRTYGSPFVKSTSPPPRQAGRPLAWLDGHWHTSLHALFTRSRHPPNPAPSSSTISLSLSLSLSSPCLPERFARPPRACVAWWEDCQARLPFSTCHCCPVRCLLSPAPTLPLSASCRTRTAGGLARVPFGSRRSLSVSSPPLALLTQSLGLAPVLIAPPPPLLLPHGGRERDRPTAYRHWNHSRPASFVHSADRFSSHSFRPRVFSCVF